jgi:hypothetical protein
VLVTMLLTDLHGMLMLPLVRESLQAIRPFTKISNNHASVATVWSARSRSCRFCMFERCLWHTKAVAAATALQIFDNKRLSTVLPWLW